MRSSAFLLAFAGAAAAETVNMMLPFADQQDLGAVSIGGDKDATTYIVGCQAAAPPDECGLPIPMVMVQGPKTLAYKWAVPGDMGEDGDFSYEQNIWCSLGGTTVADCTFTGSGPYYTNTAAAAGDGSMPPSSAQYYYSGSEMSSVFQLVTIVKETGAILNYGTGMDGKPTKYADAAKAIETGAASGMVTSKAVLPSQTGAASAGKSSMESVVSSKTSAAASGASAAASTVAEGFAAQVTGLGAAAFAAVAGVLAMAAL